MPRREAIEVTRVPVGDLDTLLLSGTLEPGDVPGHRYWCSARRSDPMLLRRPRIYAMCDEGAVSVPDGFVDVKINGSSWFSEPLPVQHFSRSRRREWKAGRKTTHHLLPGPGGDLEVSFTPLRPVEREVTVFFAFDGYGRDAQ